MKNFPEIKEKLIKQFKDEINNEKDEVLLKNDVGS